RAKGLRQYAYVLSGGGVLILYLSVYAAYDFYHLVGQPPAFVLMALVTTIAVLLSVRFDALPIAVLGLLGGFLTPVLLSTGQDNQVGLFTYIALLDAGVLALAYFKRWRSLNYVSFLATMLTFVAWLAIHYAREKLWLTIFFLSLFFLIYSTLAVVHNVLKQRPARWFDICLISVNATFFFGLSYKLLNDAGYHAALGSVALLVSAFYTGLFYVTWRWHRADRLLTYAYVGAAATFFTLALAIQLDQHWMTIGWAVEGLMLTWIGLRSETRAPRHAALIVSSFAVAHWLGWDARDFAFGVDASFVPLLNRRAFSCAVLVASLVAGAWLYRRPERANAAEASADADDERSYIATFLVLAASFLALTLLTLDTNDYFNKWQARASGVGGDEEYRAWVENSRQFSLSVLWAFYGALMSVLGGLRRVRLLRYGGLLLLGATIVKVLAFDSPYYAASWHLPLINHTFMAYAALVLALLFVARFYARSRAIEDDERAVVLPLIAASANLLALVALSLEAIGYYDRAAARLVNPSAEAFARTQEGALFALSVIWTLYAVAAFVFGERRGSKVYRYGALVLLALTAIKVSALELPYYAAAWHVPVFNRTCAAFGLLVAALWYVVRTYTRAPETLDEAPSVMPALTIVANVLAIVALSAEARGYFVAQARAGGLDAVSLRDLRLAEQLSLSVIWAAYGGALLVFGRVRRNRLLRLMALLLLAITTLKVFFIDLSSLDRVYRIVSFIVLGA
ncbi:MAG: DUF2339 domain-containing protein, partial [Pyrinomonadaceae bacterium]